MRRLAGAVVRRTSRTGLALRVALVAVTAFAATASPADAAFPGGNGLIAFTRVDSNGSHVMVMNADGSGVRTLAANAQGPAWSADGQRIAYATSRKNANGLDLDIAVMAADGSGQTDLTPDDGVQETVPSFSPDGKKIVFAKIGNGDESVWVMNVDGSGLTQLATGQFFGAPKFSPDGSQILDTVVDPNGNSTLEVMNADGSNPHPIGVPASEGDWSPDGSQIVYESHQSQSRCDLSVANADGSAPRLLVPGAACFGAAFSPDGKQVVFVDSSTSAHADLFVVPSGGGTPVDISHNPANTFDEVPSWQPVLDVVIGAGPSGTVATNAATFEFSAIGQPAGSTFECSLDGATFTACSSPASFGGLADGPHSFRVRLVVNGSPGSPTERDWTVDTTPPIVVIDSAPSGAGNPSDVTVAFHANESATFDCSLDGQPPSPCISPLALPGLSPGSHTLEIDATDAAGNHAPQPTVVTWSVAGTGPVLPAACSGTDVATVAFGPIVAVAPTSSACFSQQNVGGRVVQVSTGEVFVNGLKLTPAAGTRIVVDGTLGGGTVRSLGKVTVHFGKSLSYDVTDLQLDSLQTASALRLAGKLLDLANEFAGLDLSFAPKLDFSSDNGGQTKVTFTVKLPKLFTSLPPLSRKGAVNVDVTADFSAVASNAQGVFFTGKATVSDLYFGDVLLKNLSVAFDQAAGTIEGAVGISLAKGSSKIPGADQDAVLSGDVAIGPQGVLNNLAKFCLGLSNLGVHIGYGFFFQRVGGCVERATDGPDDVAKWSFTGGASWGPKLNLSEGGVTLFSGEIVSLDGAYILEIPILPSTLSFKVAATGTGKVFDIPFVNGSVTLSSPGGIDMKGTLDETIGGYGYLAGINDAWFDALHDDFSIEAVGEVRLPLVPGFLGGDQKIDVVVSKTGYAACFAVGDSSAGFTRQWGGALQTFVDTCDVGPFRRTPQAHPSAAGRQLITIPTGERLAVLVAQGDAGAPSLRVRPPRGPAFSVTTTGPLPGGAGLAVLDPARRTATLLLSHPAAGRWTVDGSDLASVQVADGLPPLRVRAVVSGQGARRTLHWRARGLAGGQLTLVERGAHGAAERIITTRRASGTLTFTPSRLLGSGQHEIEARVTRRGLPRGKPAIIARFRFVVRPLASPTHLRRRHGELSWDRVAGASSYAIALQLTDGRVLPFTITRPRLALPRAAQRGKLRVTVVAIDATGRAGAAQLVLFH